MGNSCTSLQGIFTNEYLKRLCSSETICENDPFWNAVLAFSLVDLDLVALSSSNSKLLEDTVSNLCKNLAINNVKTNNFRTLVIYFIRRLKELTSIGVSDDSDKTTNPFTWQVLNALFIIRTACKHFMQNLSEEVIIQQFLSIKQSGDTDSTIAEFMQSLVNGLLRLPIQETTVLLHLEIVNTLIVLLATAMYQPESPANIVFYIQAMEGTVSERAGSLVKYLLQAFAYRDSLPSYVYKEEMSNSLSSTLWSVVTLGMTTNSPSLEVRKVNMGTQGLLLLLVLANHPVTDNPYKEALASVMGSPGDDKLVKPELLYSTMCGNLQQEETTLLLYMLLHENQVMKQFILSRTTVEQLCDPLLKLLYSCAEQSGDNTQHVYLTLIILLILTEDDGFSNDLFSTKASNLTWYKERQLHDVTLGDMFILVIIKTMQYNMAHTRDRYLHTNCLAALANSSSKFANLNTYVCQRVVAFYCALTRRHAKTKEKLQLASMKAHHDLDTMTLASDLEAIEEMISMVLEILNSTFSHTVHHNANLIHVMLCHREEFEKFRSVETFQHILQNIHLVLEYFSARLFQELGEDTRSVTQVIAVIEEGLKTFRHSSFIKFPDLKFKYVEEADPGRFFVPYVWQIVCRVSNLHFKLAGK